jgi:hypothetical protein
MPKSSMHNYCLLTIILYGANAKKPFDPMCDGFRINVV